MSIIDDILRFITSGSIGGLPPIVLMAIPFVVGLIVGYFAKKFLKIAIVAVIILAVVSYLGFFGLSAGAFNDLVATYGPMAIQYAVLLMGGLPLGIGFIIGLVIGFVFTK